MPSSTIGFTLDHDKAIQIMKMIDRTRREFSEKGTSCTKGGALYFLINNGYNLLLDNLEAKKADTQRRIDKVKGKTIYDDENVRVEETVE